MNREEIVARYRRIHAYARISGMDDAAYRDYLRDRYAVRSSKDLDPRRRAELERDLKELARGRADRHLAMQDRAACAATPRQLMAVEAMWRTVSRADRADERRKALDAFCHRITGVRFAGWMSKRDVRAVMAALVEMGATRPENYNQQKEANHG